LAPQAARDLVQIWRYVKREVSQEAADRIESVIRSKFVYLGSFPDAGHWRPDLTSQPVRFLSVYSYLQPQQGYVFFSAVSVHSVVKVSAKATD